MNRTSVALAALCLAACGGGGSDPAPAGPQAVALDFTAVAGTAPVACNQPIAGLGTTGATAQLQDLRFYVSNVQLVTASGTLVPLTLGANDDWNLTKDADRVTLIDLENATGACAEGGTAAMNSQIRGTVPAGSYTGVVFTVGVPAALNHTDTVSAPKPLDLQALSWSWRMGRLFAKVEVSDPAGQGNPGSTWAQPTFYAHLGATGCQGDPTTGATVSCAAPNRVTVPLAAFNPATQRIAVDVQALLAGNNVTADQGGAPGCMSGGTDPECAALFSHLALDWKADGSGTGQPIDGGRGQTVFKAINK